MLRAQRAQPRRGADRLVVVRPRGVACEATEARHEVEREGGAVVVGDAAVASGIQVHEASERAKAGDCGRGTALTANGHP